MKLILLFCNVTNLKRRMWTVDVRNSDVWILGQMLQNIVFKAFRKDVFNCDNFKLYSVEMLLVNIYFLLIMFYRFYYFSLTLKNW